MSTREPSPKAAALSQRGIRTSDSHGDDRDKQAGLQSEISLELTVWGSIRVQALEFTVQVVASYVA